MSWLSSFFRKDSVRAIYKMGAGILKILIGRAAENVQQFAREEVGKAEASGLDGGEKYQLVVKNMKNRFPEVKEAFLNHAIEVAVVALIEYKRQ